MILYCRSCNKKFSLQEYSDELDDFFEEYLANIPCNRI
ncbi:dual CXXC motif small (seleno)protein [Desulfovulcanus ferrireducens]